LVKVRAKEGLEFSDHRIGFDLVFWGFKSTKSDGVGSVEESDGDFMSWTLDIDQ